MACLLLLFLSDYRLEVGVHLFVLLFFTLEQGFLFATLISTSFFAVLTYGLLWTAARESTREIE